ncbi:MAG: MBL fold metallo-hydrolase [Planctomycetota bacterium]|nr:MAG: MBL fold metallo-hydrolase [Planctomycetota bacterium]
MFHWDNGLFFNRPRLALDVRRRQPYGFISHAHSDHIAPHELAYCTPATACLYRLRMGSHRRVCEIPYRQPYDFGDIRLTTYPAGHCLGSAMVLIESDGGSLLYTGDFKLGESATAERAELPRADVLVMESTFGKPRYRMPPRHATVARLLGLVEETLARGATPVLHAYPLGKSQEATRILTAAGVSVLQHPAIYEVSEAYVRCGIELGDVQPFDPQLVPGRAVVTLPQSGGKFRLPGIRRPVSIAVTGWAIDASTKYRWGVDHALPLSDHADFDELFEAVERVGADEIYCLHGPAEFAGHLRAAGYNARPVVGSYQQRMF